MKPGVSTLVWSVVGTAMLAALLFVVLRNQRSPSDQLVWKTRRLGLVTRMRSELTAESEAEKSAVMAITDSESQKFADEARAKLKELERDRGDLEPLLKTDGTDKERELLGEFSKELSELQRVDREVLELAVKNTNLKAWALAFGAAADAIKEIDGALSRLIAENAQATAASAKKVMLLAARADAAAFRIDVLLPPHIAEESDARMDALEAAMAKEDDQVKKDLKDLGALAPSNHEVAAATAGYAKFSELRKQILRLSRENTNVRSLSLSLNQKRNLMLVAESALSSLEKSIAEEPIAGVARPR